MRTKGRLRRDEEAVTEVIGYILTFALSAVILLISIQAFNVARNNSDAVVTAVELKAIANRIAQRVIEAGQISQDFPNATFSVVVSVPQEVNGHGFYVEIATDETEITAVAVDGTATASSTTFNLEELDIPTVSGEAQSSNEKITITYSRSSGTKTIRIA